PPARSSRRAPAGCRAPPRECARDAFPFRPCRRRVSRLARPGEPEPRADLAARFPEHGLAIEALEDLVHEALRPARAPGLAARQVLARRASHDVRAVPRDRALRARR